MTPTSSRTGVGPAHGPDEAVRREVQERVERMSEPVAQHFVARAVPTDVANDQVRRRQHSGGEADEDGQGDERHDDHHDEDEERRAHEQTEEDQSSGLDRAERQRSREADVGDQAGLPVHRFDLDDTAGAHDAVERGAVGNVLVTVAG